LSPLRILGGARPSTRIAGRQGEYRIRFVYSTDRAEPKFWLGDATGEVVLMLNTGGAKETVAKLLANVPKTTVSSNEITVKVVKPKK
jgi:hypothetical protein